MKNTYEALLAAMPETASTRRHNQDFGTFMAIEDAGHCLRVALVESYRSKQVRHYVAKTMDQAQAFFDRTVNQLKARADYKTQQRKEAKDATAAFIAALKPGVILEGSWGWEQTQVEFFIVLDVKGAKVTIQELGHIDVETTGWASCHVMPDVNVRVGEPMEKVVRSSYIRLHDSATLTVWDGKRCYKSWYA